MRFDPQSPLAEEFCQAIQSSIDRFLDTQRDLLSQTGDRLDPVWRQAVHFTQGGKRIRPAFCYWGYVAAAGYATEPPVALMDIAASLDLLHVSALVHDDVIDSSDTRRGGASAHRRFEALHRERDWQGDPAHFGVSAAILFGDLLGAWSISMVEQAPMSADRLRRARPYLDAMRVEVLAGQCLDLFYQAQPSTDADMLREAGLVMGFKTAKYTVARPVQIGAALGGADDDLQQGLSAFGTHVGYAFQMRDDLLGLFGDPAVTGKPTGDDLREGKKTVLIGYAMRGASPKDSERLAEMLGDPALTETDVAQARDILLDCGAVEATEKAIITEATAGMKYLHRLNLTAEGAEGLASLVHAAVERTA
ncbi:MAG: polyprenyl synthetase family protein [Propionibacteriaceae bacterium]|jgi:geranylgeranyl diphosphate synthase type I|nr:polyprenyl synthetase family protein [Propionibacteriaceae bacterium]